jgi:ribosomal protein L1
MHLLRGWSAKQQIFVQSSAARWAGNTKVVAMVRVVPNDHHPRGIKGKVKFPHPIVSGSKEGKKERIAVILSGDEGFEEAKAAGMIVGDKDYLDKVRSFSVMTDCRL